jgi:tRNA G18 (ribose-2'-O)-methylase SpoU
MHVNQGDPRLEAFANLRDRDLRRQRRLIAEGRWLAHRLVSQGYPNTQVLTSERFADEFAPLVADSDLLVADNETMSAVVGFDFHRGVIASSDRPVLPTLAEAMAQSKTGGTVVVLPDTSNAENLGSIFRTAAGLGVEVILLGEQCCDEFSRRVLRVSMGAAFGLKITRSTNLDDDLSALGDRGYKLAAMVLDESALDLADFRADGPTALMFGSEADGLAKPLIDRADVKLTIPMSKQVDSLNLAASAAIALWRIGPTCPPQGAV